MKHFITLFLGFVLLSNISIAQSVPQGMKYQAVARDAKGQVLANTDLQLKVTLYTELEKKEIQFEEIHQVTTNALGLFSITIGEGLPASGDFSKVPWSTKDIWMEIGIQSGDDVDFITISNSKMLSVPYAFHAATAGELVGNNEGNRGGGSGNIATGDFWGAYGNLYTNPAINKLGTLDRVDLVVVTNNIERMRIFGTSGNISMAYDAEIHGGLMVDQSTELNREGGQTINHGNLTVNQNTNLLGTLDVTGNTNLQKKLTLGGTETITDQTQSNSLVTGSLVTMGGAAVAKNLNVGGNFNVNGESNFGGPTTFSGALHITNTTQSTSTTTGALIVDGGVGIAKRLNVGEAAKMESSLEVKGLAVVNNNTNSLTKDDGALVVTGGVGVKQNVNIGGYLGVKSSSTGFVTKIENTEGSTGDGLEIKLGKTHPAWNNGSYLNVTNPLVEQFDTIRTTIEGWINGNGFNPNDLLLFNQNSFILGSSCYLINLITDRINDKLGLPAGFGPIPLIGPTQLFPGLNFPDPLPDIPSITMPGITVPQVPVIPSIPQADCSVLPAFSVSNISLTDVANSLDNKNQFISFKDKDNRELGSVRAESVTDWRRRFFSGDYFVDLMGEVVGLDILSGYMGALNKFTEIASSHNAMGVEYASGHGDYAEWLERINPNENINAGDIVGVQGGKISKDLTHAEQIMAVSKKPIVLGNIPDPAKESFGNKIAFMGQIPVKVMGPVAAGDYVVGNNATPGYGVAVHPTSITPEQAKLIVGRSWDTSENAGPKMINTVIGVDNGQFLQILSDNQKELQATNARVQDLESKMDQLLGGLQKFQSDVVAMNQMNAESFAKTQAEQQKVLDAQRAKMENKNK